MSADWALMRAILAALADDDGQADGQLAERLGAPAADVRRAARILYRHRRADFCWGYIVLPARAREGRRAA